MSDWKPGDVASILGAGSQPAFRTQRGWTYIDGSTNNSDADRYGFRPLVVIDPEDREAVRRLGDAFCLARWDHLSGSNECDPLTFSSMRQALREFTVPKPPRPDEPQGLGAVVEDADGGIYVRTADTDCTRPWSYANNYTDFDYAQIDVVRVLSEGVRP